MRVQNLPTASNDVTISELYMLSKIIKRPLTNGEGQHHEETWAYNSELQVWNYQPALGKRGDRVINADEFAFFSMVSAYDHDTKVWSYVCN